MSEKLPVPQKPRARVLARENGWFRPPAVSGIYREAAQTGHTGDHNALAAAARYHEWWITRMRLALMAVFVIATAALILVLI